MSRTTKIILGIAIVLLVICLCAVAAFFLLGGWFTQQFSQVVDQGASSDPQEVNSVAITIADFSLPAGYQPEFRMQLLGITMVSYSGVATQDHIMLMQFPTALRLDPQEMERQMRQALQNQQFSWANADMEVVETKQVDIRGEQAVMTISEGGNAQDQRFRQASAVFEGKGGPAMLLITSSLDDWDPAKVDAIVASIR
jgi:hypothetical protein